jgi:hypothetical protein
MRRHFAQRYHEALRTQRRSPPSHWEGGRGDGPRKSRCPLRCGRFRIMITVMPLRTCRTSGALCILFLLPTDLPGRCPCGHMCRDKFTLKGEGKENSFLPLPTGKGAGGMGQGCEVFLPLPTGKVIAGARYFNHRQTLFIKTMNNPYFRLQPLLPHESFLVFSFFISCCSICAGATADDRIGS